MAQGIVESLIVTLPLPTTRIRVLLGGLESERACQAMLIREEPRWTEFLKTPRLTLRPFDQNDAKTVQKLAGSWSVASMLSRVPYPYEDGLAEEWIATHEQSRQQSTAFRYAVTRYDQLIGATGIQLTLQEDYAIGYWIGQPFWGLGYATEAARTLKYSAARELNLTRIVSSHFADNPKSGRVLEKLGFRYTYNALDHCLARGQNVKSKHMEWTA